MEVRFESMVCLWDDEIPTMFLEFMNLLTFCQSEEQLRAGVKDFAENADLLKVQYSLTGSGKLNTIREYLAAGGFSMVARMMKRKLRR